MRSPRLVALLVASAGLACAVSAQAPAETPPPDADVPGRQAFLQACAACHGADGDGHGTTLLDRPARSFSEGGFSFGNTPEAIFRTLSFGIPGSPMPAFGGAFSEQQLREIAQYVVSLGPPLPEVSDAETIMTVSDRPRVARGILPPITDGAPLVPRGLLVGLPGGLTFEYRIDDVRLLGVRAGEFARRSDWTGRGGTPLEPLGKLIGLCDGGQPGALFVQAQADPGGAVLHELFARLTDTALVGGESVRLSYALAPDAAGAPLASVDETPSALSTPVGSGYRRHLRLRFAADGGTDRLGLRVAAQTLSESAPVEHAAARDHGPTLWWWHAREDGVVVCTGVRRVALEPAQGGPSLPVLHDVGAGGLTLALQTAPGQRELAVELLTVLAVPAPGRTVADQLADLADT